MRDMTEIFRLFSKKKIAFFGEQFCSVEYSLGNVHASNIHIFYPFTFYEVLYSLQVEITIPSFYASTCLHHAT